MLLEKNATVYLAARSEARAKAAIAELLVETGKEPIWLELDLSSLRSIENAAAKFHKYVFFRRRVKSIHYGLIPGPII